MTTAYVPEFDAYPDGPMVEGTGDVVPLRPETVENAIIANISSPNLAEELDDTELTRIGAKVIEEFEVDESSRDAEGWTKRNEAALKLAMQVKETKTYPWPNAANIKYPLIAVAAIQFNARAYPAIVDGSNVVKGKVLGKPSEEKRSRADRIARHMSYQLLEQMEGWEEDTDRLLIMLPIVGTVFRKSYFNPTKGYNCSELIGPDKLVVNYWAKPLDACPRVTQVCEYYPHEVEERFRDGRWRVAELGRAQNVKHDDTDDAPHVFCEQHRLWDLDDDGYPEPYIVTVHKETEKVVRIVARYDEDGVTMDARGNVVCIEPVQYFTKYGFIPSMDGSFYDIGFGTLLDALNETINSTINQLMDAGHLANTQSGFISEGVTIKSGTHVMRPGEFKKAEVSGGALKDSIVLLPTKEPSSVLFQLLGMLIDAAKDITATKDILTGETQGQNQPVGTTLATIEQGLKVFTAIYKRIHRSLKQELGCLYRLNRLYLSDEEYYTFQDEEGTVARSDYEAKDCDVVPVSDPSVVTDMQRVARAQYLGQFLGKGLDDQKIIERMLEAGSIPDIKELFPEQAPPNPELMLAEAELRLKEKDQVLDASRLDIEEAESAARIAKDDATAAKTTAETALMGADLQAIADFIDQRVAELMAAGAPNEQAGAVQPGELPSVEGQPPDAGVPGLPEGQPVPSGGEMGPGGGDVAGLPNQGEAYGPVGADQV